VTSTQVWVSPSASSFSCLCEPCLERARTAGLLFTDAIATATVRGELAAGTDVSVTRCPSGHEIVLRRFERPPSLARPDDRQLQLS
jgi:hypothetical protein